MARTEPTQYEPGDAHSVLVEFVAATQGEAADLQRMRALAAGVDAFDRGSPFHLTASALIIDPDAKQVLLRWHARHQRWMQVGGHGDPGERDPYAIALREAREESGLSDLRPFPSAVPAVIQVVVVPVPASANEPEHRHGDIRYLMATSNPDAIQPETADTPLRWCSLDEARELLDEENLLQLLTLTEEILLAVDDPASAGTGGA